jgi:hypothetical protein
MAVSMTVDLPSDIITGCSSTGLLFTAQPTPMTTAATGGSGPAGVGAGRRSATEVRTSSQASASRGGHAYLP